MHVIQDFYRHYDSLLTLTDSLGDTTVPYRYRLRIILHSSLDPAS